MRAGSAFRESGGTLLPVLAVEVHPKFEEDRYDVAVLKVTTPFVFSDSIQGVKLPARGDSEPRGGTKMVITGWGRVQQV